MTPITLTLPYPPSVNKAWRTYRGRMLLAKPARDYRDAVSAVTLCNGVLNLSGQLDVAVIACPPDGKLRDIDNVAKSLLDAMRVGKVYRDDSQVRRLRLEWGPVTPGGRAVVCIGRYESDGNLILALAERVHQQSELLGLRAEVGRCSA